ncbi:MAG: hypothetical protein FWD97_04245 [Defluviitaleaceae bacterium]|nr:hypothetical protein [Defluviitaleaceae bacterium]
MAITLRRYIWPEIPTSITDQSQIQCYQLNALLLSNGLAEVLIIVNVRNEALFREIAIPLSVATVTTQPQTETPTQNPARYI